MRQVSFQVDDAGDRLGFNETEDNRSAPPKDRVLAPPDHPGAPPHLIVTDAGRPHLGPAAPSPVAVAAL